MPFKSKKQMRYMFAKHPKIAKRWEKEYDTPNDLPESKAHESKEKKKERKKYGISNLKRK